MLIDSGSPNNYITPVPKCFRRSRKSYTKSLSGCHWQIGLRYMRKDMFGLSFIVVLIRARFLPGYSLIYSKSLSLESLG